MIEIGNGIFNFSGSLWSFHPFGKGKVIQKYNTYGGKTIVIIEWNDGDITTEDIKNIEEQK